MWIKFFIWWIQFTLPQDTFFFLQNMQEDISLKPCAVYQILIFLLNSKDSIWHVKFDSVYNLQPREKKTRWELFQEMLKVILQQHWKTIFVLSKFYVCFILNIYGNATFFKNMFFFLFFFVISKKNFSLQQTHSYSTLEIINNKIQNFNLGNLIIIWIVKNSHKNCLFLNMPSHFLVQHKYL